MTETKHIRSYFALLSFIIASFLLFGINNARATDSKLYSVKGISVDATAASASEARTLAVAAGQRRAYKALLRNLIPRSYHDSLPEVSDADLTAMITGFQVSNEKTSATRYLADLIFDFKPESVRPILQANNLPYAETRSKPVLILPVYDALGAKTLWGEPNPWRDTWIDVFENGNGPIGNSKRLDDWAQTRVVPIMVPSGSLDDIRTVSVEDAVGLNGPALTEIADSYGAGVVMVVYASLQNQGGIRRLDVSIQRNDAFSTAVVESYTGGQTNSDIFRTAIFDIVDNLQEGWKDQYILDRSIENKLAVSTTISSLSEWMAIQEKTKSVPAVQQIKIRELSVEKAFWEISFVGEIDQLSSALAQRDLFLNSVDGFWLLEAATHE
ncbi:DUF2066 domain-containing protein [Sneathiella aquimaris]|uniref:DUF2066 domain-containing protein n=1 Tax=Sneathiella aquimaris TaxID=2599305 RepID=UPI00146C4D79|nr:DUF2066 domain-containing protein [Sneathiella aquimaris]